MCTSRTHRITITNFCLGKHLVSEDDLLKDQRGSPAYISPDVLSGEWKGWLSCVMALVRGHCEALFWRSVCPFFKKFFIPFVCSLQLDLRLFPCVMWFYSFRNVVQQHRLSNVCLDRKKVYFSFFLLVFFYLFLFLWFFFNKAWLVNCIVILLVHISLQRKPFFSCARHFLCLGKSSSPLHAGPRVNVTAQTVINVCMVIKDLWIYQIKTQLTRLNRVQNVQLEL